MPAPEKFPLNRNPQGVVDFKSLISKRLASPLPEDIVLLAGFNLSH